MMRIPNSDLMGHSTALVFIQTNSKQNKDNTKSTVDGTDADSAAQEATGNKHDLAAPLSAAEMLDVNTSGTEGVQTTRPAASKSSRSAQAKADASAQNSCNAEAPESAELAEKEGGTEQCLHGAESLPGRRSRRAKSRDSPQPRSEAAGAEDTRSTKVSIGMKGLKSRCAFLSDRLHPKLSVLYRKRRLLPNPCGQQLQLSILLLATQWTLTWLLRSSRAAHRLRRMCRWMLQHRLCCCHHQRQPPLHHRGRLAAHANPHDLIRSLRSQRAAHGRAQSHARRRRRACLVWLLCITLWPLA